MNVGGIMGNIKYGKPIMTNLPKELGKRIFEQMDKSTPDREEMERKSLEFKLKVLNARKKQDSTE